MPAQKKQHYVPRCILKNFTINNCFYIFQVNKNNIINKSVPYKDHCYTDYMYGKDKSYENWLKGYEDRLSPIIEAILKNKALSNEDQLLLKQYILIQYMRTEHRIDVVNRSLRQVYEKIVPVIAQFEGITVSDNLIKKIAADSVNKMSRAETAINDVKFAESNISDLKDLHLTILISKNNSFVSSDNPVIFKNLFSPSFGLGTSCAGIILFWPISPKYCLMLYDDGMRIDLLMRDGRRDDVEKECKRLFYPMAERTGTLWENNNISASCNHGFASYAIKWLQYLSKSDGE